MLEYLVENKEWLFSGAVLTIAGWVFFNKSTSKMVQKGGNNSKNMQAKRDITININGGADDEQ